MISQLVFLINPAGRFG